MRLRLIALALLLAVSAAAQTLDPNASRGFQAGKLYNFHGLDSVSTFNGNLGLNIPIGQVFNVRPGFGYQFMLSYNSKMWDYIYVSQSERRGTPERESNTSLGWTVGLGRLLSRGPNVWAYQSADGAVHELGVVDANGYYVTGDGSYIRAKRTPATGTMTRYDLEFPDGTIHTFNGSGFLTEMKDRYDNWVRVDYSVAKVWTITDGHGTTTERTHTVKFESAPAGRYAQDNFQTRVKTVELAGFGTQKPVWTFVYDDASSITNSSCGVKKNEHDPATVNVPLLKEIQLPDGSSFGMAYVIQEIFECTSGSIKELFLPTGGSIAWTHGEYDLASEDCTLDPTGLVGWTYTYPGVKKRELKSPDGTVIETTTYAPVLLDPGTSTGKVRCGDTDVTNFPLPPQVMRNSVTTGGNTTEHYFSAYRVTRSAFDKGQQHRDYGLPFTRILPAGGGNYSSTAVDGKFLSTRAYEGTNSLQRTMYLSYERDSDDLSNTRVKDRRTVFETDTGDPAKPCKAADGSTTQCWIDQSQSDFDGFGHYRTEMTSSNFPGVNNRDDRRTGTRNYNPGVTSWPADKPWILNTYTTTQVTENTITGTISTTTFEEGKGVIRSVKRGNGANALVSVTCRDARGFPTSERAFGGSVTPPTDLCSATHKRQDGESILNHAWAIAGGEITHTAQYDGATFKSIDEILDLDTWLPKQSKDPAGLITTYAYDASGRITTLQPPGVKSTTYAYTNASVELVTWDGGSKIVFKPARVEAATQSATLGSVKSQYHYDAAGRLWREKTLMPDDSWTLRETLYDNRSNKASGSELEKLVVPPRSENAPPGSPDPTEWDFVPANKTVLSNYDPFGRVGSITTSDGKQTSIAYTGARVTTRTQHVAGPSGDAYINTEERLDAHGRLMSVTDAAGTPSARTTKYTYDVLGNLASVSMPGENEATQTRKFTYDDRSLLSSEEHPELGANGYGKTEYLDYDASGRFRRKRTGATDGSFDVKYAYDAAGRLTEITLAGDGSKLKEFEYKDKGRLSGTARYNRVPDLGTVIVTEGWGYDATTGIPVRRDFAVDDGASGTIPFTGQTFLHTQALNDLGGIASTAYPCRSTIASNVCESDNLARTVEYVYDNGPLSEVKGWAKLSYQPNGMPANVEHGRIVNNAWQATANETWAADPNGMSRPRQITVKKGQNQHWTSGEYKFDGSGNIIEIGTRTYAYDPFGRLAQWTHLPGGGGTATVTMDYDPFGNQLRARVRGCSVTGSGLASCWSEASAPARSLEGTTNHYTGMTYDAAGNVTDDGRRKFTYDGLNTMTSATVGTKKYRYLYDANDERIAAVEIVGSQNRTTWTLRGFRNELLRVWTRETNGTWSWKEDEIWRGTSVLGIDTPQGRRHYALDHLGSPRVVMDETGALLGLQHFDPFGDGGLTGTGALQFTGHERDFANIGGGTVGLPDYAHARYLDTGGGRFLSPDSGRDWDLSAPQSWNMYSYARNSPIAYVDPDGEVRKYFVKMVTGAWRRVERAVAIRQAKKGGSHGVKVEGPGASKAARKTIKDANPHEEYVRHDAHPGGPPSGPDQHLSHWQPKKKSGGQVNYILGVLFSFIPFIGDADEFDPDEEVKVMVSRAELLAQNVYGRSLSELTPEEFRYVIDVIEGRKPYREKKRKEPPCKDPAVNPGTVTPCQS